MDCVVNILRYEIQRLNRGPEGEENKESPGDERREPEGRSQTEKCTRNRARSAAEGIQGPAAYLYIRDVVSGCFLLINLISTYDSGVLAHS